jgi:serine protease Do
MRLVAGFAVLTSLVPVVRTAADPPNDREVRDAIEKQLKGTLATAGPSVVCVVVSRSEKYPKPDGPPVPGRLGGFDRKAFLDAEPTGARARDARRLDLSDPESIPDHAYAGGVVIDPAGMVLTTWSAIDGATKIFVHLGGGKGSYADIHAADSRSDFAVLKLLTPPPGLKPIRIGDPDRPRPALGSFAVLLTRPYRPREGIGDPAVALGPLGPVIKRRPQETQSSLPVYQLGDLIEYRFGGEAEPGGGALLTRDGELIGLTTGAAAVTGDGGPGYALPIDPAARRVIDMLAAGGEVESGFLGVVARDRTGGPGLVIGELVTQGPAALGGLRVGDVVTRINDTPVTSLGDLHLALRYALAGTKAKVAVLRGGQTREFEVVPGKAAHQRPFIASARPDPVFGLRVDFNTALLQQQHNARGHGVPPGVVVRDLAPDSPAAVRFKALGEPAGQWLITHINGTAAATPAEFYKAAKGKPSVKLTVIDPLTPGATPRDVTLP